MIAQMKSIKPVFLSCFFTLALSANVYAASCEVISEFEGLIFDAGAFPASKAMEERLDFALLNGVEKITLFPHPATVQGNQPEELEETFPDLIIQGARPWGEGPVVVWPEPLSPSGLHKLEEDLINFPNRMFLLGHVSRFKSKIILRLVEEHKNLWLGLNDADIKTLLETCGTGPIRRLMTLANERVVFTSFGLGNSWKNYKWQIARLKKLASLLPKAEAEALIFYNAEQLYGISVNAP